MVYPIQAIETAASPEQRLRRAEMFAFEALRRVMDTRAALPTKDSHKLRRQREIVARSKAEWWRCYTRLYP